MSETLVEARNLSCEFRQRTFLRRVPSVKAVSSIDLVVGKGEIVGLVGESGSGKSTVGRLILGLTPSTAGEVLFDGQSVAASGPKFSQAMRRRMQLIFQDPYSSLDPRRRIGPQIADGIRIHGLIEEERIAARVGELLSQVGLSPDFATRFPYQFSGGQLQRIAIARALATEPDFIVADEAVSALDVSVQAQVIALIAGLRRKLGLAVLFISHDLSVIRHLCDRVVVLYLGRVVEEGPVGEVFHAPKHPYTMALLSAVPSMDPGRLRARMTLQGEPPSPVSPPSGCAFRTRCPIAVPACAESRPALKPLAGGSTHQYACLRGYEAGALMVAAQTGYGGIRRKPWQTTVQALLRSAYPLR